MKNLKQKLFPHQSKLQAKWWHRLAKVLFWIPVIFTTGLILTNLFNPNPSLNWFSGSFGFLIGWIIFCYFFYYWGIVYIAYGRDK